MKKIILFVTAVYMILAGCKKADFNDNTVTGEGLVDFTLLTPSSGAVVQLNAAIPATAISFTWNAAKPGLNTAPKYKVVAVLREGGDFNAPLLSFDADNAGAANKLTLTYKQLDDALGTKGIAAGATADLKWSVTADNGSKQLLSQSTFFITVTRFKDGASPFYLLGPVSSTNILEINPTSTTESFTFNWTRSKPAAGGPAVTYKILFAERKLDSEGLELPIDWTTGTLFSITSNNNGIDSFATVTYKALSDSIANHGYSDLGLQANLKWTVQATSGSWKQNSDYKNDLFFLRQVKMYLVGSVQGWNINEPLELITDKRADRYGKVFYTYIKIDAGGEFKFFKTKGDWGSGYGNNGTSGAGFSTGFNVGGNFVIATAGIYRLTLDVGTNMAYVQQKQVGVVGNMQGWDAGAPLTGGYIKRDHFLIIANSNGSDAFKFHDGPEWNNSTPDKARWWGDAGSGKLNHDGGDPNLVAATSPRTRLIWDGTNGQELKYEMSPAAEMRVVGNGINQAGVNDWDPGSSPQMTYSGNGVWTISLALKANMEIKFLAGNAWGAFDYEDNSGQSNATGTAKPIVWNGDKNFKTPATAGTYTITLNEYTQTVTIN